MPQTVSVIQCILWAAVEHCTMRADKQIVLVLYALSFDHTDTFAPMLANLCLTAQLTALDGYHLSELNFPVASLTCSRGSTTFGLPDCLPVTDAHYSIITAVYTIGGLCGSLGSSYVVQRVGLAGGIAWSGWSNLASALIMGLSWHWVMLGFGRFVAGVSSGIAICLVPPYLAQLAKTTPQLSQRSGLIGSMHQVGIVTGLFVAQVVAWIATGERGDLPGRWRVVVLLSGAVSVWQVWAAKRVGMTRAAVSSDPIAGYASTASGEETGQEPVLGRDSNEASEPLLAGSSTDISSPTQQLALRDLLSSPTLRGPTVLCATILALQQLSGVNAVMFYSTPVLKPLLPASAALIGLGITGVNALMTLPAVFLIDTVGRKRLLLYSVVAMGSLSALLAYGLDGGHQGISAFAIVAFIGAFAVGLGPVPWLFVSELVPQQAIPALSALSLSTSWILNFFIALLFLPLRDALSEPDPAHPGGARINEGRVFYVFFCTCGVLAGIVYRWLPKDK